MMGCCKSKVSGIDQYGFKMVPDTLEDITPEWCEKVLQ